MRRVQAAIAAFVVICFGGPALAGEPPSSSSFNWSGFYVGGQIGYSWAEADHRFNFLSVGDIYSTENSLDGVVGGAYAGMNLQSAGNFVFGVEADVTLRDKTDRGSQYYQNGSPYFSIEGYARVEWSVGARARIGYAIDHFLPYIAVGFAAEKARFGYEFGSLGNSGQDTMIGLTLGTGVEYAVTNHIIARLDYRYSDFDGKSVLSGDEADSPAKIDLDSHDLLFGIAYKF